MKNLAAMRMGAQDLDHSMNSWETFWSGRTAFQGSENFQSWILGQNIVRVTDRRARTTAKGQNWFLSNGKAVNVPKEKLESNARYRRLQRGIAIPSSFQSLAPPRVVFARTTVGGDLGFQRQAGAEDSDVSSTVRLSLEQLLKHPLAIISVVPKELSLFFAGAAAGAVAKTTTAPLDRVKLLMQVRGVQAAQAGVKSSIGFVEAFVSVCREEGVKGLWKGNTPQVIRVIPYSAVQLFAYENYKRILKGDRDNLSIPRRLAAGAFAGMTSTLVTYPLDTLRLRMAVDPAAKSMGHVVSTMIKQEGLKAFYSGLGPSLLGIAPYIALNFCVFDLIKSSLPAEVQRRPQSSLLIALASSSLATSMCYPLDTVRRQMQLKGSPFKSVFEAFPGIVARDGFLGLYRGFLPNALKSLPNSSIRLTTFDAAKNLIEASQAEYDKLQRGQIGSDLPTGK